MKRLLAFTLAALMILMCAGCSKKAENTTIQTDYSGITVRFAQQFGMHYAPAYVMKELGLLEKRLPGVKVEWNKLGGGSAMNEALISNQLDVAFMGIPPVIIAIDKGVEYRIACGLCVPPAELIVRADSGINSLSDIKAEDKIAVPSIGSIQHIMLSLASKDILGEDDALENSLIAMANPDAYAALKSGSDIVGHFASMPYIDLEIKDGMKSILDADDCGGGATIVCVTTKQLFENKEVYNALMGAIGEAVDLINAQDAGAVRVISEIEKISEEDAKRYIVWPGTIYSTDLYRLDDLGNYMREAGFLTKEYKGFENVTWAGAKAAD